MTIMMVNYRNIALNTAIYCSVIPQVRQSRINMFPYRRISINLPSLMQENAADLNSGGRAPTLVMTEENIQTMSKI